MLDWCRRDGCPAAFVLITTVNLVSAILFIALVRRPVYDDPFNMYDVHAYATRGVSITTVQAQRNAPGPTSFIWMSCAVRLMGGDELLDARVAVLLSWLLLVFVVVTGARQSGWPQLWYGALLATLVFPHSLTASASALTEGPALLFATIGFLAWTEYTSPEGKTNFRSLALGIVGGLSIGLAATCRQYYLALLPAAGLLALFQMKSRVSEQRKFWVGSAVVSLAVALMPVVLLVATWGGITCPGIATGSSYGNYHAGVGVSWPRPLVVAFYTAFYLVPFSFPAMWQMPVAWRWPATSVASVVGLAAAHFRSSLINPGPLHSLLGVVSRIPSGTALLMWLIASATTFNAIAVTLLLWRERSRMRGCTPVAFALLTVFFFILEQLGVGGNIPFYDRYVLQCAPFLGLIGFWLFPHFTRARVVVLIGMAAVSHIMLWRYALAR